jgi:2-keto-4-pentenoate hydratase
MVRLAIGVEQAETFDEIAHPFGGPFDLFCWTVNHVSRLRGGLKRGDVIITGSYCGIVSIRDPQAFVATFADYGDVILNVL